MYIGELLEHGCMFLHGRQKWLTCWHTYIPFFVHVTSLDQILSFLILLMYSILRYRYKALLYLPTSLPLVLPKNFLGPQTLEVSADGVQALEGSFYTQRAKQVPGVQPI